MSYRLITKATLTIIAADGTTHERVTEVRAYPSPKRDASGAITVDGASTAYKRTGGKGRGTADNRYMYFPLGKESAYTAITESEAAALIGGTVTVTSIATLTNADVAILTAALADGSASKAFEIMAASAAPAAPAVRRVKHAVAA